MQAVKTQQPEYVFTKKPVRITTSTGRLWVRITITGRMSIRITTNTCRILDSWGGGGELRVYLDRGVPRVSQNVP